jgi:hypothetical protein
MSYGITIKNSNNDILADGERIHPFFHQKEDVYTKEGFGDPNDTDTHVVSERIYFNSSTKLPFVLLHTSSGKINVYSLGKNGSYHDSFYYKVPFYQESRHNMEFHVYLTGDWPEPPTGSNGIAIYNSNGECIIHSEKKTLELLDAGTVSLQRSGDATVNFGPTNKKPLLWVGNPGVYNTELISSWYYRNAPFWGGYG